MTASSKKHPRPMPPVAERKPKVDTIHGDTRQDDYFWLREKDNPAVTAYLKAENDYAKKMLAHTEALQKTLYSEMLNRIKETDLSVPYLDNGYYYYYRTEEGLQYEVHCRKKDAPDAPEEVTLDLNRLAEGKPYLALGPYTVSDDNLLLAYAVDMTGFREYTLYIKDLQTGELLPDLIEKVGAVVWAADNRTLFYTTENEAKRSYRLYRHTLGVAEDDLVYEEKDELFHIFARRTRSRAYIFLASGSHTTTEIRYLPADRPEGKWLIISPRVQDREYEPEHHGENFYLRINDTGRNFRLVAAPVSDPRPENWREIIPHREEVMLEDIDCFENQYVLYERRNGLPEITIADFSGDARHSLAFPEPVYEAYASTNRMWNTGRLRYGYQSLVTPYSVMEYDIDTGEYTLLKQTEVLGGYDASSYTSERLYASAGDGTRIPVSLVYRNDVAKDGNAPLLLIGYGAYGLPYPVTFSSTRLTLLERGGIYAIAHIRGGGELGQVWHDEGRMMRKTNTFTDFIGVAQFLIEKRYASADRMIIEGGSAGGMLTSVVANLRPDLFRAVVSQVPFVDLLNSMLDATLPLTVGEYEEWGNPNIEEEYAYIRRYCPYTNLKAQDYPAMLVKTSLNDSQVMYWEPAKYVAKLRTLKRDDNPLLLVTNMEAGHGGASGRYDRLRELALDYAFMFDQWGLNA